MFFVLTIIYIVKNYLTGKASSCILFLSIIYCFSHIFLQLSHLGSVRCMPPKALGQAAAEPRALAWRGTSDESGTAFGPCLASSESFKFRCL